MDYGTKIAVFCAENKIKKKDFAKKICKYAVELSNYINGNIIEPDLDTGKLIVFHTDAFVSFQDIYPKMTMEESNKLEREIFGKIKTKKKDN